jgi:hypothetical protein
MSKMPEKCEPEELSEDTGRFELAMQKYVELLPLLDAILGHMREQNKSAKELTVSLRRTHRSIWALLVLCALTLALGAQLFWRLHHLADQMAVTESRLADVLVVTQQTEQKVDVAAVRAAERPSLDVVADPAKPGSLKVVVKPGSVGGGPPEPGPSIEIPIKEPDPKLAPEDDRWER